MQTPSPNKVQKLTKHSVSQNKYCNSFP